MKLRKSAAAQGTRSACIASKVLFELRHEKTPDPTVADAVMDGILHRAYRIAMRRESMRTKEDPLAGGRNIW